MDRDILLRVVEVEKEIQERLETEGRKAAERIDEARLNAGEAVRAEESRLDASFTETVQEAQALARKQASEILKDARSFVKQIDALGDDILLRVLQRHITRILPGD